MFEIGVDDLSDLLLCRLGVRVLARSYYELEAPEAVHRQTESTAHRWPRRIAEEAEVFGKEEIVNLLRGVAFAPQREVGMGVWRG